MSAAWAGLVEHGSVDNYFSLLCAVFIVEHKNKETLSSASRRGFLEETPYQKHLAGAQCPINSKLYYKLSNQVILRIPLQLLLMQSEMKTKMKRHVGWVEQK